MFFAAQSRLANFDNSAPRRPAIAEANFCAWLCGPPPPSPLLLLLLLLSSLSIVVGKSFFLYTIFRGLLSLLVLVVVKMMIKMKLKNK